MQRRIFLSGSLATAANSLIVKPKEEIVKPKEEIVKPYVVKSGKSRFNENTKLGGINPNDIKISSKDSNGQLTVFEYIGSEKGGPALHIHPNQDEIFYILEGNYKFQVGDENHLLGKGDTIFLPRNIPHAFAQLSKNGKMLFFFQPSGKMEDFFRSLGSLNGPPSPEIGSKLSLDHEMKVVGPPISLK